MFIAQRERHAVNALTFHELKETPKKWQFTVHFETGLLKSVSEKLNYGLPILVLTDYTESLRRVSRGTYRVIFWLDLIVNSRYPCFARVTNRGIPMGFVFSRVDQFTQVYFEPPPL